MTMQARIIGPASELGHFETLDIFGNAVGREFTDVELTAEQVSILEKNHYVELKGQKSAPSDAEAAADREEEAEASAMRARLAELGEKVDGRASVTTLRKKLETAEKAQAEREEEAERKAAEAAEAAKKAALAKAD